MTGSARRVSGAAEPFSPRLLLARALLAASIGLRNAARRLGAGGNADAQPAPAGGARPFGLGQLPGALFTRGAVFRGFLLKDLYFSLPLIVGAFLTAALALGLLKLAGAYFAAFIVMFCAGSAPAAFLVLFLIHGERQERSHLFALSLPISPARYMFVKVLAVTMAYAVPWVVLGAGVELLLLRTPLGSGLLPYSTITWLFVLDQYFMLLAVTVISPTVGTVIAAMILFNISPTFFFYYLSTNLITATPGAVAVWSPNVLRVIAGELTAAAVFLALTLWGVMRQRDQT
jgi:hypothetical protein